MFTKKMLYIYFYIVNIVIVYIGEYAMKTRFFISLEVAKLTVISGLITLFASLWATETFVDRRVYLMDISMTGYRFFEGSEALDSLQTGETLFLKRQGFPNDNSIEIYNKKGERLGFVPAKNNSIPTLLLDQNVKLQAVVKKVYREDELKDRMKLAIYQVL